jgi:hypothetical protein
MKISAAENTEKNSNRINRIEQDNLKPITLKFLFYPAYPVNPVNNPRLSV